MDSDPAWVAEKCYLPVEYVDGVWMRLPLTFAAVSKCSILLTEMEMTVYAQSEEFLEAVYKAADGREQLLAAKRIIRGCNKEMKVLQQLQASMQRGDASANDQKSSPSGGQPPATYGMEHFPYQQQQQQHAHSHRHLQKQPHLQLLPSQEQKYPQQRRQQRSTSQGLHKVPEEQEQQEQLRRKQEEALAKLQAVAAGLGKRQGLPAVAPRPSLGKPAKPAEDIRRPSQGQKPGTQ
eukprot:gene11881-12025_t